MNIYEYKGPEVPLDSPLVTVKNMTIAEIKDETKGRYTAQGRFTFYDHVEGCAGEDPWVAVGTLSRGEISWVVRRKEPTENDFTFTKNGEALSCLGDQTNLAIKTFIATKLSHTFKAIHDKPDIKQVVEEQKKFSGEIHTYKGPCVCQKIRHSSLARPFDWKAHTNNGHFPKNCFECCCGERWYRINPEKEVWALVGDRLAWEKLMTFDGVITEPMSINPQLRVPSLFLVTTLRAAGFIPIG